MSLKSRLKKKRSTGLLVGRDKLTLYCTDSESGPMRLPLEDRTHAEVLEELVRDGLLEGRVTAAIDPDWDFLVTKRGKVRPGEDTYLEYLESQMEGGLVSHTVEHGSGFAAFRTLHAFPKRLVNLLRERLEPACSELRLIPATFAALSQARQCQSPPKKYRAKLRVILGPRSGLAVLVVRDHLLARRVLAYSGAERWHAVTAALRSLLAHAEEELGLRSVDGAVLHVEEQEAERAQACLEGLQLDGVLAPAIPYGAGQLAEALAGFDKAAKHPGCFDLLERIVQSGQQETRFPLAAALPALAAVALTAAWLYREGSVTFEEAQRLRTEVEVLEAQTQTSPRDVDDRLDALRLETLISHSFLMRRAFWTGILEELPSVLPPTARLESLSGRYPLLISDPDDGEDAEGYSEGERFVRFDCTVPVGDESCPPEVAKLNAALKRSQSIQANFPAVNGVSVQILPEQTPPVARLSAVCEPRGS